MKCTVNYLYRYFDFRKSHIRQSVHQLYNKFTYGNFFLLCRSNEILYGRVKNCKIMHAYNIANCIAIASCCFLQESEITCTHQTYSYSQLHTEVQLQLHHALGIIQPLNSTCLHHHAYMHTIHRCFTVSIQLYDKLSKDMHMFHNV